MIEKTRGGTLSTSKGAARPFRRNKREKNAGRGGKGGEEGIKVNRKMSRGGGLTYQNKKKVCGGGETRTEAGHL